MKKTYITPCVITTIISTTKLMATSTEDFNETLGTTGVDGGAALIKENPVSNYNVWDDDWSK